MLTRLAGKVVTRLEYQAYSKLAIKTMGSIVQAASQSISRSEHCSETQEKPSSLISCALYHRLGTVPVGEPSIGEFSAFTVSISPKIAKSLPSLVLIGKRLSEHANRFWKKLNKRFKCGSESFTKERMRAPQSGRRTTEFIRSSSTLWFSVSPPDLCVHYCRCKIDVMLTDNGLGLSLLVRTVSVCSASGCLICHHASQSWRPSRSCLASILCSHVQVSW